MNKFSLTIICTLAIFATTDGACSGGSEIAACTQKKASTTDLCKIAQNMAACYPKDCCHIYNGEIAAGGLPGPPKGCTATCGGGATTPSPESSSGWSSTPSPSPWSSTGSSSPSRTVSVNYYSIAVTLP